MGDVDLEDAFPTRDHSFYGRSVAQLGEDGDAWLAAGHDRRSYAALNAMARYEAGTRPMLGMKYSINRNWATFIEECGCTEDEHTLHGEEIPEDVDPDDPEASDAYGECWDRCEYPQLPPCGDECGWMTNWCSEDRPGAVPVLYMSRHWQWTTRTRRSVTVAEPTGDVL